ncbi:hypothetical protein [Microbacterium sp. Root180]|uniref:hypothetical protein n=1 Tax=Microbacterium sp. Root180 TaxID=1736483 RepID=UPI0012FCAAF2|nr:hypothetical protein [Microbacterium sp. Root180]
MSQDDTGASEEVARMDFSPFVRNYFPSAGLLRMKLVDVSQEDTSLHVVFDGVPEIRAGRFGVRIATPAHVGDERWNDFPVAGDDMEEWASLAIILDLVEVYDTTAQGSTVLPDSDGIIWLS